MFSLSFIGLIAIVAVVALLISKKVSPIVAFTLIPIIAAAVAGFDLNDIGSFFSVGVNDVISVAVMFIFAILFFALCKMQACLTLLSIKCLPSQKEMSLA
jgi:CitMHS family citrate-Mg2+:H+ or citrate-Ca2+:H+ symporter